MALLVNTMFPPGTKPLSGVLSVEIICYCTKPKTSKLSMPKPDVDNLAKGVLDSLNGHLWADDSQIKSLQVSKWWAEPKEAGYFILLVYQVGS